LEELKWGEAGFGLAQTTQFLKEVEGIGAGEAIGTGTEVDT
jgi:hypothetical protein